MTKQEQLTINLTKALTEYIDFLVKEATATKDSTTDTAKVVEVKVVENLKTDTTGAVVSSEAITPGPVPPPPKTAKKLTRKKKQSTKNLNNKLLLDLHKHAENVVLTSTTDYVEEL